MKRGLIISTAVILLLALALVFLFSNIMYCPAPISLKAQKQLFEDFSKISGQYIAYDLTPCWYSAGLTSENCRIYGKDNGYYIFFISVHQIPMRYEDTAVIDGIAFYNPKAFSLYAYKDGEFTDIKDAYEQGLISRKALVKAQEYHNQCLGEKERMFG